MPTYKEKYFELIIKYLNIAFVLNGIVSVLVKIIFNMTLILPEALWMIARLNQQNIKRKIGNEVLSIIIQILDQQ